MTFKANDLALCVDARGLQHAAHPTPREGRTYTVSCVETCCATRVGLAEVPTNYEMESYCLACGAAHLTRANFYARRFVKVGNTDYAIGARAAVKLARRRDHALDAVSYLTKEV